MCVNIVYEESWAKSLFSNRKFKTYLQLCKYFTHFFYLKKLFQIQSQIMPSEWQIRDINKIRATDSYPVYASNETHRLPHSAS